MSYNYESFLDGEQIVESSGVTRSIRSINGGYPGFNASSHSLGGNVAVLTKSASATNNNSSVSRIAQDLLELQRGSRRFPNFNAANYSLNASFFGSAPGSATVTGANLGGVSSGSVAVNRTSSVHSSAMYLSEIEQAILRSSNPIELNESEEITVNGERGILANRAEIVNWRGLMPISEYEINVDANPEIITKRTQQTLEYVQELAIRYLRPPTPPAPGEIVITQEANTLTPPAPPLIIRQQPARPDTPEPLVIREAPPAPPAQVGRKVITISGKRIPPPPRKVVIERLAALPSKPQSVIIERWLPYSEVKRRVIFNKPAQADPVLVKPRNIIVQWEAPQVQIKREYKYLGVIRANPVEYVQRFGSSLTLAQDLPQFVVDIETPDGLTLAANYKYNSFYELEGDVQALKLIDLEKEGLGEYRAYIQSLHSSSTLINSTNQVESVSASVSAESSYQLTGRSYSQQQQQRQSATLSQSSESIESLIEYIFRSIDRDNNGRISVEEAEKILLRLNSRLDRKYGEDDVRAFFNALDINQDGTLDLEEFKRAFLNLNNA